MKKLFQILFLVVIISSCNEDIIDNQSGDGHNHTHVIIQTNGFPNMKVPNNNPLTKEGIALGRKLFYDPLLSGDNTQSCASCHQQQFGFADNVAFSEGIDGLRGTRNAPGLTNIGWSKDFFWDGRAESLEKQAEGPVENPIEMHANWDDVVAKLKAHPTYPDDFKKAFADPNITKEYVTMAIAQFERTFISDKSKYDQYKAGNATLTPLEAAGMNLFFSEKAECFHCHGDPLMGDYDFHNIGLDQTSIDFGLEDFTGDPKDRGKFKSPSLRNIELSAPYMHDGRYETLEQVINFYSDSIKSPSTIDPLMPNDKGGFHWTELEKLQLIAFLKTLTDTSFINDPDLSDPN